VRVQPRARRDAILGWRGDGALSVCVSAPPLDGRANAAVGALLAQALGLRPAAVRVIRGERGRDKVVRVEGLARGEIARRLGAAGR
jgi:hypothetical protein